MTYSKALNKETKYTKAVFIFLTNNTDSKRHNMIINTHLRLHFHLIFIFVIIMSCVLLSAAINVYGFL